MPVYVLSGGHNQKILSGSRVGMNRMVPILVVIGAIAAAGFVATLLWEPEGPITLDEERYRLGENIFMKVRGLQPNDAGNILIYTPTDKVLSIRPYDGSQEPDFNFYFTPDTVKHKKICSAEELVGKWRIVFEDGSYPDKRFEIVDEYLPGFEKHLNTVC